MNTQVQDAASLVVEIPNSLRTEMGGFLETHPTWDQDRVFRAALSLFLLQHGHMKKEISKVYLDSLDL